MVEQAEVGAAGREVLAEPIAHLFEAVELHRIFEMKKNQIVSLDSTARTHKDQEALLMNPWPSYLRESMIFL